MKHEPGECINIQCSDVVDAERGKSVHHKEPDDDVQCTPSGAYSCFALFPRVSSDAIRLCERLKGGVEAVQTNEHGFCAVNLARIETC